MTADDWLGAAESTVAGTIMGMAGKAAEPAQGVAAQDNGGVQTDNNGESPNNGEGDPPVTQSLGAAFNPDPTQQPLSGQAQAQLGQALANSGADPVTLTAISPEQLAAAATGGTTTSDRISIPEARSELEIMNGKKVPSTRTAGGSVMGVARFNAEDAQYAGYSPAVSEQLADYPRNLQPTERNTLRQQLNDLSPAEHAQIQTLLNQATPATPDGSSPGANAPFAAALVARIASLSSDDRARVLSNVPQDTQQADAFSHFLGDLPGAIKPDVSARLATYALAFPGATRYQAMNLLGEVTRRDAMSQAGTLSATQQRKQDAAISALMDLAAKNGVPETLAQLTDSPSASSPEGGIMPMVGKAREFASRSSYDEAIAKFAGLIREAAKSPDKELRPVFQTGTRGRDAQGNVRASIHGAVADTVQSIRLLGAMADKAGVYFKPTVVVDSLNEPVLRGVLDELAVGKNNIIDIRTAPSGRWSEQARSDLLSELNPTAVLSFGHSTAEGGAKPLIGPANDLNIPTFAIGDYTDGSSANTLATAQHGMAASFAGNGVAAFNYGLAREFGSESLMPNMYRVGKAYEAAENNGAISDDARFGASPGTVTKETLIGSQNYFYNNVRGAESIGDGPSRMPTGLERLTAQYPTVLSQHEGSAQNRVERYSSLLQRAQPPQNVRGQLASMRFRFSQASATEKGRIAATAAASGVATGFIIAETMPFAHPDAVTAGFVTAIAALGTALRQYWITKVAGLERLAMIRGVSANPDKQRSPGDLVSFGQKLNAIIDRSVAIDPASDFKNNRRRYSFDWTGFGTYPISIAGDVFTAMHPGAGGVFGDLLRVGAGLAAAGLVMVDTQYARKAALLPDVDLAGKYISDPGFSSPKLNQLVDLARIPLALSGALNIADFAGTFIRGETAFNAITTIPNYLRNLTNIAKANGVWFWQHPSQNRQRQAGVQAPSMETNRPYQIYDGFAATFPGTVDTMWAGGWTARPQAWEVATHTWHGASQLYSLFGEGARQVLNVLTESQR